MEIKMKYEIIEVGQECGEVEYQVSDVHPNGERTHSYDFVTLAEAEECLDELNTINNNNGETKMNFMTKIALIIAIVVGSLFITKTAEASEDHAQVQAIFLGSSLAYHENCNSFTEIGEMLYELVITNEAAGFGMDIYEYGATEEFQLGYVLGSQQEGYTACMKLFEFLWETNSEDTQKFFVK